LDVHELKSSGGEAVPGPGGAGGRPVDPAGPTRRGRPRDPEVDEAIRAATVDVLLREGFARLTMEEVADRAGVGKASLYRRWPNKAALVVDALQQVADQWVQVPDTGSVHDDMLGFLRAIVRTKRTETEVLSAIGAEVACNAELAEAFRTVFLGGLHAQLRTIVQRGVDRGELPPSTDVEMLAAVGPAVFHHQRLLTGGSLDERTVRRIVDQFYPKPSRSRATTRTREAPTTP
jgi:AcrR family transcriptional regulator